MGARVGLAEPLRRPQDEHSSRLIERKLALRSAKGDVNISLADLD
jgi:hypothetical protein